MWSCLTWGGIFRAYRVRVEHEVHSRTGLTRSSGIRGGCQSVVPRTDSCHALSFCMERRAVVLRRDVRAGCFKEVPLGCRAVSQPNNSRAWRADNFLTFLTASSTALILDTLAGKLVWSKQVRALSGSLNSSDKAKNGAGLAISFLNSALTLRVVPINCRFGFTKLYHLETDKKLWQSK